MTRIETETFYEDLIIKGTVIFGAEGGPWVDDLIILNLGGEDMTHSLIRYAAEEMLIEEAMMGGLDEFS